MIIRHLALVSLIITYVTANIAIKIQSVFLLAFVAGFFTLPASMELSFITNNRIGH
jgi:hypothetical protein